MTPVSDTEIRRARALARVLDTAVGVPGTPIRLGLDAVLGLVPGAGDVIGAALSGYIVMIAVRSGAPPTVIWRMLGNVGIDTLIGTLPVVGDLFDVAYKSNVKNVALLERYATAPVAVLRDSRRMATIAVLVLLAMLIGLGVASVVVARAVWHVLSS